MEDFSNFVNQDGPAQEALAVGNYAHRNFRNALINGSLANGKVIFDVGDDDLDDRGLWEDEEEEGYDDGTIALFEPFQSTEGGRRAGLMKTGKKEDKKTIFDDLPESTANFDSLEHLMGNVDESGLVKKQIIRDGDGTPVPCDGRIYFHYAAYLDGQVEPYDTSLCRKYPQSVDMLETDTLMLGLAVAIKSMKIREAARFLVDPELAYGKNGCPPRIPPNSRVLFIVEILQHIDAEQLKTPLFMTPEKRSALPFGEILNLCNKLRSEGNLRFKHGDYRGAIGKWRKGLNIMDDYPVVGEEDSDSRNSFVSSIYCNLATGYLKLELPAQACNACKMGLKLVEGEQKAVLLYRFAKAKFMLNEYDDALSLVRKGQSIEPNSSSMAKLAQEIKQNMNASAHIEKEFCKRMFSNKPTQKPKLETTQQSEGMPKQTGSGNHSINASKVIGNGNVKRNEGNQSQTKSVLKTRNSTTGNGGGLKDMPVSDGKLKGENPGFSATSTNAEEAKLSSKVVSIVSAETEKSNEKTESSEEEDLNALLQALEKFKLERYTRIVSFEQLEEEYEDQDEDTPENAYSESSQRK